MDEESVNWSHDRYSEIQQKLTVFLRDKCDYDVDNKVFFIPISGLKGHNIKEKVDRKVCPWYNGPSLLELFDEIRFTKRNVKDPTLRVPVLDTHNFVQQTETQKAGFYLYGKIENGVMVHKQKYTVMPSKKKFRIKRIYNS
jgi:peptide chain release factor subunit 3